MDKSGLINFLRSQTLAAQSSVSPSLRPQCAIVGFAISDDFEFVFDTMIDTRKTENLRANPEIALTIGGFTSGDERSVQCNGTADELTGDDLNKLKAIYFEKFPAGIERDSWDGITYFRVRPQWMRYGDYGQEPMEVEEFTFD